MDPTEHGLDLTPIHNANLSSILPPWQRPSLHITNPPCYFEQRPASGVCENTRLVSGQEAHHKVVARHIVLQRVTDSWPCTTISHLVSTVDVGVLPHAFLAADLHALLFAPISTPILPIQDLLVFFQHPLEIPVRLVRVLKSQGEIIRDRASNIIKSANENNFLSE